VKASHGRREKSPSDSNSSSSNSPTLCSTTTMASISSSPQSCQFIFLFRRRLLPKLTPVDGQDKHGRGHLKTQRLLMNKNSLWEKCFCFAIAQGSSNGCGSKLSSGYRNKLGVLKHHFLITKAKIKRINFCQLSTCSFPQISPLLLPRGDRNSLSSPNVSGKKW
jgi:hypothetical protein